MILQSFFYSLSKCFPKVMYFNNIDVLMSLRVIASAPSSSEFKTCISTLLLHVFTWGSNNYWKHIIKKECFIFIPTLNFSKIIFYSHPSISKIFANFNNFIYKTYHKSPLSATTTLENLLIRSISRLTE